MKIWVIGYFKEYFDAFNECGVIGKALRKERGDAPELEFVSIPNYMPQGHKDADDSPYGGGAGMVLRADIMKDVLFRGVIEKGNYGENWKEKLHLIHPSPRESFGVSLKQKSFFKIKRILFISVEDTKGLMRGFLKTISMSLLV